jgi:hypothetical protein
MAASLPALAGLGLLWCVLSMPAAAQTSPPAGEKAEEKAEEKAGATADEEAMARARRQARNPMRWILEAGRLQRKTADAAPPAAAAAPERKAAVAVRLAPEVPVPVPTVAPAAEPAIRVTVEPLVAPPAAAAADPSPSAAPVPAEPVSGTVTAPADPLVLPPPVGLTMASPVTRLPVPALPEPIVEPQLLQVVEPALAADLIAELSRTPEVNADLHLNRDGTVGEVRLLARLPRSVQRVLLSALSQWRFAPLAEPTVHRVQLVFER